MSLCCRREWLLAVVVVAGQAAAGVLAGSANGADEPAKGGPQTVEMFAAIRAGQIEVQFIPANAKYGNILVRNKTKQPLLVKLPDAAAGVPTADAHRFARTSLKLPTGILAQFAGGGAPGGNQGAGGGGNQGMGMGMGGGMGGMGGGMGGGFFNVAPEKVGKFKVDTVCLEHGKKDPNPRIPYTLVQIEQFTQKSETIELCRMLGRRELSQNVAQAVAWHLENGLSWEELANKDRVRHLNGQSEKFFTPGEMSLAFRAAAAARQRAGSPAKTPAESLNSQKNR